MGGTDAYRQTELLWERLAEQRGTSAATAASSSPDVEPVSLSILRRWRDYIVFCRSTVARQVDWREVLSYLDETQETAMPESPLPPRGLEAATPGRRKETSATPPFHHGTAELVAPPGCAHSDVSNTCGEVCMKCPPSLPKGNLSSVEFVKCVLAKDSAQRFGTCPFYLHQQHLLRWTKLLAQCITQRLLNAAERGNSLPQRELQWYRLLFLARAWEVVGAAPFLHPLAMLLEREELEVGCATVSHADNIGFGTSFSQSISLGCTLTMTFTPPRDTSIPVSRSVSTLAVQSLDALWVDVLHIPWDVLDPKSMTEKVRGRLLASPREGHEKVSGVMLRNRNNHHRMHSSSLKALLSDTRAVKACNVENPLLMLTTLKTPLPVVIELHQLHIVTRVLETAGYVMLTKIRCSSVKWCYHVIPFLADFIALRDALKKVQSHISSGYTEVSSPRHESGTGQAVSTEMVDVLLQALADSAETLYAEQMEYCLYGYARVATKHLTEFHPGTLSSSSSAELTTTTTTTATAVVVSRPALFLLERVVEPTFEVLMLYLGHHFFQMENRLFAHFVIGMLKAVLGRKVEQILRHTKSGSRVQAQCRADYALLMRYIDTHPVTLHFQDDAS